jgi:hypothetical protein
VKSIRASLLVAVFAASTSIVQADVLTFDWSGVCEDCPGGATGRLTVTDGIPTTFSYSSAWLAYTMQVLDFDFFVPFRPAGLHE